MGDELLNETLFVSMGHALEKFAAWIGIYNAERPHSSLGCATPAAFVAEFEKQWADLPLFMRNNDAETQNAAG